MSPVRILVLEDNEADFLILEDTLSQVSADCELVWERTLKEGVAKLNKGDIDIILYDLNLPDSKGCSGLERFIEIAGAVPVVVVTGNLDTKLGDQAVAIGAQDFVSKNTMDGESIWKSIRYAFERHKLARERLLLQERINQTERYESMSTLAAGLAHDIGNLLTPVLMSSELGLLSTDDALIKELFEDIRNSSKMASEVSRQLMALKSSDIEGDRKAISFSEAFNRAASLVSKVVPPSCTVSWKNCDVEHSVKFVAQLTDLQQILLNLVNNSLQAMRDTADPEVSLDYHYDETLSRLHVTVRDNGPGFQENALSRAFEPFFTTKKAVGGTGLGLPMCKGLIERMKGEVFARNREDGGAEVGFWVPALDTPELPSETEESLYAGSIPMRILFVDDDEVLTARVRELLILLGYQIETVSDPQKALEKLSEDNDAYDMIVTDFSMPKINGIVFASKLLELKVECPIVLITAYSDLLPVEQLKEMGITKLLFKPFEARELIETMKSLLVKRSQEVS